MEEISCAIECLEEGGLWDVTPTIQNGQYVHDVMGVADANDKQWYLTKLEKKVNKDTIPLMKAADNSSLPPGY